MINRRTFLASVATVMVGGAAEDEEYKGPKPPKKDVPYLLHAERLIETEVVEASQSQSKGSVTFSVPGVSSPARTPLAEPIFLLDSDRISPDRLGLYRFEVKNGRREINIATKRRRGDEGVLRLSVRRLRGSLYRVEAAMYLDNGEYSLSPEGENTAFCFAVY